MATARKLNSGSWRCQVYSHTEEVQQQDGSIKKKRIYKSFTCDIPGARGKRECERMAAEWAAGKEQNHGDGLKLTLGEAIDTYIESRESIFSPCTVRDYRSIRRNHVPDLMKRRVQDITQEHIQVAINLEALKCSPKTVRNVHALIYVVMGVYRPNMAIKTVLPKKVRSELYVPTEDDIRRLLGLVKDTEMELPVLLAAFGPMRRGEIAALRTENISGNVVHVCKNMVRTEDKQWIIKAPKSFAGDRYIDFPDFVAQKFPDRPGRVTDLVPSQITDRFARLLKSSGLPHFRFHDLRHYSASIQHALGIPDAYIMQRGGWGNDGTLKNVYRHALKDKEREMSDKANKHFEKLLCNTKCNTA